MNDLLKSVKKTMEEFMSKEEAEHAFSDILPEYAEKAFSKPNQTTQTEIAQDAFAKINETLAERGLDTSYNEKLQKKMLKDIAKDEKKEQLQNRADLKNELGEIQKKIDELYFDLRHETSIAKLNGCNPENVEKINDIGRKIADKTSEAIRLQSQLPSIKENVLETVRNKSTAVIDGIKEGFNRIKDGLDMKIKSGIGALTRVKDEIALANDRFSSMRDTAYTNVVENVEQVHRNWLAANYAVDRTIVNELDKQYDRLEASYDRKASIKGAFKDLGRAIMGKERTGEKAEYTPRQQEALASIKGHADTIRESMNEMKKQYDISKAASMQNIRGAQEYRKDTGLNMSNSLERNMQRARERSIEGKKNNPAPEKATQTKNTDDRAR